MLTPMYRILLHAGAAESRIPNVVQRYKVEYILKRIAENAKISLAAGPTAVEVVKDVVVQLENHASFNTGKGAVFTEAGTHELEAAIMDRKTGGYGAVACYHEDEEPCDGCEEDHGYVPSFSACWTRGGPIRHGFWP